MKSNISLVFLAAAFASQASAAIALTNGNFSTNDTTGWTVGGAVNAASGAAVIDASGSLLQDFDTGTGLVNFTASYDIRFGAINNAHRMRFEGDGGTDLITLRLGSASVIESFNAGPWTSAVTGLSLNTTTTYTLAITGSNFGSPLFKYTISLFDGSTQLGTSVVDLQARHLPVPTTDHFTFQTFTVGASTGGVTVDNFTVVPEPSSAILGGLPLLALLRRRRE